MGKCGVTRGYEDVGEMVLVVGSGEDEVELVPVLWKWGRVGVSVWNWWSD